MSGKLRFDERDAIQRAIAWLHERLPEAWEVGPAAWLAGAGAPQVDGAIEIRGGQSTATLVVEAKASFQPRDVERLQSGSMGALLRLQRATLLVVAPWLSQRARERLEEAGINFLDYTGNALIKLEYPALFVKSDGATRNPRPETRGVVGLGGRKAGRLIRLLTDVKPPYGVGEIAVATALTPGYVSRLLDTLDREALVERSRRGRVESVDLPALVRRWAQSYDLFESNEATTYVAPNGADDALAGLASLLEPTGATVTGSFAAIERAPVAASALLAVYTDDAAPLIETLGLLPADEGANVMLLKPFDPVARERTWDQANLRYAALSQVAVDCLTGNGRMPAEGVALLEWMVANEDRWRAESLDAVRACDAGR
jgi:hypothetical protein